MKPLVILFCVSLLAGCALFEPTSDKVISKLAEAAEEYCANIPESERLKARDKFNAEFSGTGAINCP